MTDQQGTDTGIFSQRRIQLEIEKLELEKTALRRPWWQSTGLISTLVASLVTVALSWGLGLFDLQRRAIDIESKQARYDLEKARDARAAVEVSITVLNAERVRLDSDVARLQRERDAARKEAESAKAERLIAEGSWRAARLSLQQVQKDLAYTKAVLARPAVFIETYVLNDEKRAEWALVNKGPGPATLRSVTYFVGGKQIEPTERLGKQLSPVLEAIDLGEDSVHFRKFGDDFRMSAGARLEMFWIAQAAFSDELLQRFKDGMEKLAVAVCFCSIENQCELATKNSPPSVKCP